MNTQDLIALAAKHGAKTSCSIHEDNSVSIHAVVFKLPQLEAFCAALAADQPKADERGSAEPDMRAICEALGFDPTNHHNAAKCPYCRPTAPARGGSEPGLREALEMLYDVAFQDGESPDAQRVQRKELAVELAFRTLATPELEKR